jgi:4-amino-4-deoxy-L-arabinose transferase-like glycosyltransferase
MKGINSRHAFWLLLIVGCLLIIPFLGLADFHTKGEPREAVVASSMIESGNWILPRNNGGEIPYKPPFFHWGVAAAASLTGGVVGEFASRLPSAIALIAMAAGGFLFYARRKGVHTGLIASLVTLTAFELHRAGANCRVDMVLTALTVGALYLFYRWWEKDLRGIPWIAILLMSCATLTKGPVGLLIPCLAFGVFLLLRGMNFFRAFWRLALCGIASFILPLAWYYAAYLQGGQEFLDLVMEENFGRMTSTMAYDSCVNPWPYNFMTVAAGYLPWILLVVFSLFGLNYKVGKVDAKSLWSRLTAWVRRCDPVDLFSLVCIVVIFVFYCFPQSKRSVYLMPIYPFIAYFLAQYMLYLVKRQSKSLKVYGWLLAAVSLLLFAVFLLIKFGIVGDTIFHGKHAVQNIAMLHAIGAISGWAWLAVLLPVVMAVGWFLYVRRTAIVDNKIIYALVALTFGLYLSLDGAYQPAVLNAKSQRPVAQEIDAIAPASSGVIYEYIQVGETAKGDPVHFFELNFYLGDRIENFLKQQPDQGYLLIPEADVAENLPRFEAEGYRFTHLYDSSRPVLHQTAKLYCFHREAK